MKFKRYQHVCRIGTSDTEGLLDGKCFIYPKVDGCNSSVYLGDDNEIKAGSRNRELSLGQKDNRGFYESVLEQDNLLKYLLKHPTHRLFGEYLVPHSLRTYEDSAWKKFYVFDVCTDDENGKENHPLNYLPYEDYAPLLEEFDILYIKPLAIIDKPTMPQLKELVDNNKYLIKEGSGAGEGLVIKSYDFVNKFGCTVWGKILHDEFSNGSTNNKGKVGNLVESTNNIEMKIIDDYVTTDFVNKEYAKIINDNQEIQKNVLIPTLIQKVWHEFIDEEMFNVVKKYKNPTISFGVLNKMVINKIKEVKPDLFTRK